MAAPAAGPRPTPATPPDPVAVMRRNVWVEIGAYVLFGGPLLVGFWRWQAPAAVALTAALLALTAATLYYHSHQLTLLRRLQTAPPGQRPRVAGRLRRLLRLGRRASLALAVGTAGLVAYLLPSALGPALLAAGAGRWLAWAGLALLASLALAYGAVRWHQWTAYGRYLARLEAD